MSIQSIRSLLLSFAFCGFLAVAATVPAVAQTKAVVMPVDLEMYLLTAGGTREFQPEWTETGTTNVQDAFNKASAAMFDPVSLPELTGEEQAILEEHMALFDVAIANSVTMITTAKLKHKIDNYDYTLGPGLAWLADKSGADKLVMFSAVQEKSSGGRVAMMILGAAVAGATGVYVAPGIGSSYGTAGIVDLVTGNIEWANYRTPVKGDLRKETSANSTVDDLMQAFPKGRLMRSAIEY